MNDDVTTGTHPGVGSEAFSSASGNPGAALSGPDGLSLQVADRALELTLETLRRHGNRISSQHQEALKDTVGLFTQVASGELRGRYVLDLPTGLGKTTSVVCWAKAMVECGADWSLAICASRVEELCDIYTALTSASGPSAMPEELVGFWHAKQGAALPPTFPRGQERRYGERPILLLTHRKCRPSTTLRVG